MIQDHQESDLAGAINALEFKLYETASNIGMLEDARIKLIARYTGMKEQDKRLQESLAQIKQAIKCEDDLVSSESKNRKKAYLRYSQLLKQLEDIDGDASEVRKQLAHNQQILDVYSNRDRVRERKLTKILDENVALDHQINSLEMKLLQVAAATNSVIVQKDQEIVRVKLKYENDIDACYRLKTETGALESSISELEQKYERIRRADHAKEVQLMQNLTENVTLLADAQQASPRSPQNIIEPSHDALPANNRKRESVTASESNIEDISDPIPANTTRPSSGQLKPHASVSSVSESHAPGLSSLEKRLQDLETVLRRGVDTNCANLPNSFEMMEARLNIARLENLLQMNTRNPDRDGGVERLASLQLRRDFDELHAELNSRLLLLDTSIRKQVDVRVSVTEETNRQQNRIIASTAAEIESLAVRQVELTSEVRTLKQASDTSNREVKSLQGRLDVADSRFLALEAQAKTQNLQTTQIECKHARQDEELKTVLSDVSTIKRVSAQMAHTLSKTVSDVDDGVNDRAKSKACLIALHNRINRIHKRVEEADYNVSAMNASMNELSRRSRRLIGGLRPAGAADMNNAADNSGIPPSDNDATFRQLGYSPTRPMDSKPSKVHANSSPLHRQLARESVDVVGSFKVVAPKSQVHILNTEEVARTEGAESTAKSWDDVSIFSSPTTTFVKREEERNDGISPVHSTDGETIFVPHSSGDAASVEHTGVEFREVNIRAALKNMQKVFRPTNAMMDGVHTESTGSPGVYVDGSVDAGNSYFALRQTTIASTNPMYGRASYEEVSGAENAIHSISVVCERVGIEGSSSQLQAVNTPQQLAANKNFEQRGTANTVFGSTGVAIYQPVNHTVVDFESAGHSNGGLISNPVVSDTLLFGSENDQLTQELVEEQRRNLGLQDLPVVFADYDPDTASTDIKEMLSMLAQEKKALRTDLNKWKLAFCEQYSREPNKSDRPPSINAKLAVYTEVSPG
jgi:hypothetical protein